MWTLVVLTGHWQWTLGVLTGPWQCECFVCVDMSLTVWTLGVCWQVIDSVNPKCVDRSLTVWMFCLCWQITDSVNALCWWVTDSVTVNVLSVLMGHWQCDNECFVCVDRSLAQMSVLFGNMVRGMSAGARVFEVCWQFPFLHSFPCYLWKTPIPLVYAWFTQFVFLGFDWSLRTVLGIEKDTWIAV